ncbi:npr-17 [Pristionchus pacificus]|uniref:Npr-17 n=1 Tax=Pristionchus pacificus TaxID=54126 RepID=A0A2A6BQK5_PRIPA|nr:npr-17 [Pristionchus pacificus]|eukprot:PDM68148.1 npr-17 [Pristionchus pacificus]
MDDELDQPLMVFNGTPEIVDVLPPPNHEDTHVVIMAATYILLFLLGTCGNVAVLTTILHILRNRNNNLDNTLLYIIVLSCVDFGVCLSLPFTIIDQILGVWMFGSVLCKLHAVFESFGKIFSSLILTAMSFDRYAGVCISRNKKLRSRSMSIYILIGLSIYAMIILFPLIMSFETKEIILFEKMTGPNRVTRMKIEKCTIREISSTTFSTFTIFQFIFCFILPLGLVTFFYTRLLMTLRKHARNFKSSHIPLMRISLYTLAVACFYFICWTPFWAATVYAVYLENLGKGDGEISTWFVYCMYFIHALPFMNSAINWILYGALNSQLQQRASNHSESTSARMTKVTATPVDRLSTFHNGFKNTPMETKTALTTSTPEEEELIAVRLVSNNSPALL